MLFAYTPSHMTQRKKQRACLSLIAVCVCLHACTHVCVCVGMFASVCLGGRVCVFLCVGGCVRAACVCVCVRAWVCVGGWVGWCVCVHVRACVLVSLQIDDLISTAADTKAALASQRSLFANIQSRVKLLSERFPAVRRILGEQPPSSAVKCMVPAVAHCPE